MKFNGRLFLQTLNTWLRELDNQNAAPLKSIAKARSRAATIGRILINSDFGVIEHVIGGSAAKGTATAFMADVDLYVYIDADVWRRSDTAINSSRTVRGAFRERLTQYYGRYDSTKIRLGRRSARVQYLTAPQLDIDVVPLLVEDSRRFPLIGDKREGWIPTSLHRQTKYFDEHNRRQRLGRFIRLMKLWRIACKDLRGRRWGSYTLEVLGHWMCAQSGAAGTGEVLFRHFLKRVAEDGLPESIRLGRWRGRFERPTPSSRQAISILDPAVPMHDIGVELDHSDREKMEHDAWSTHALFEEVMHALTTGTPRRANAMLRSVFKPGKVYRRRGLVVPPIG